MKLAFCLFNYFPYGGLQRDFLRIARLCRDRGHDIHVFTMRWEGEQEEGFHIHVLSTQGFQNHSRCRAFVHQVKSALAEQRFDRVIGFNKMPYLDVYYAADVCYVARIQETRGWFYRCLPRYRAWKALEENVFAEDKHTQILLIAPQQAESYTHYYQTPATRFHLLPPGIEKNRVAPSPAVAATIRERVRAAYAIDTHEHLLLMVGSGFKTKGVDRALRGLAALPTALRTACRLIVIGKDDPKPFVHLAHRLGISSQVKFVGGRYDVPDFLLAADLLLQPSYHENTGTAILEAIVAGLPVLTVAACGYAPYVLAAKAGAVLPHPFQQTAWNGQLERMLISDERKVWQQNALQFAQTADLYSLPEKAVSVIEAMGR